MAVKDNVSLAADKVRAQIGGLMRRKGAVFQAGNQLTLLQGSREFFPALVAAMDGAKRSIYFETYIFDTTASGAQVADALMRAAQRGVAVHVVLDGFGTGALAADWDDKFKAAGVQVRIFSPPGRWFVFVRKQWQRLHRKLCAVDESIAFCGGINILDDFHDPNHGALESPRLDFSVQVTGPVALSIASTCRQLWRRLAGHSAQRKAEQGIDTTAQALLDVGQEPAAAMLVLRDNLRQRRQIEMSYLRAIGLARERIIIANAYFFPSRKLLAALVGAAKRGVRVQLLLQGRYEYFLQFHASRSFYQTLLNAGVEIYEYSASFLHAKVAVIDADTPAAWATVGSSNLDPLSLLLAREANVVAQNQPFAMQLEGKLQEAMVQGQRISLADLNARSLKMRVFDRLAYGAARAMVWVVKDRF